MNSKVKRLVEDEDSGSDVDVPELSYSTELFYEECKKQAVKIAAKLESVHHM